MNSRLFLAGASVRSAAQSACRAGQDVEGADLFADQDLADCCRVTRVTSYGEDLPRVSAQLAPCEWAYTGGLENEPELVDTISARHRLLGNGGSVLRQVRDPWRLAGELKAGRLLFPPPRTCRDNAYHGAWVCKPLRSCGGLGIRLVVPTSDRPAGERRPARSGMDPRAVVIGHPPVDVWSSPLSRQGRSQHREHSTFWSAPVGRSRTCAHGARMSQPKTLTTYYQPWIPGAAYGAAFVAARGRAQLWGLTRQLIGSRWAGAAGFQYVGSIGPVRLDPARTRTIRRIGDLLADRFSLRGLFGVDLVVDGNDIWTIEVNPRYCASFEILERVGGPPAMAIHMEACRNGTVLDVATPASEACHAKAIIFAQRQLSVTPRTLRLLTGTPARGAWPAVADVPREKTMIQEGHPILTMFAEGASASQAYRQIRVSCQRLRDSLERHLE